MSRTTDAWRAVIREWRPFEAAEDTDWEDNNVRACLRRLIRMQVPIAVIDEITELLRAQEKFMIESTFCERCNARMDGTDVCSRCDKRCEVCDLDSVNGLCDECTDSDADDSTEEE